LFVKFNTKITTPKIILKFIAVCAKIILYFNAGAFMNALIVDQDRDAAESTARILSGGGFRPVCLNSYDDALDYILNKEPAMVFAPAFCASSDISVFISKIRSFDEPVKSKTPVICVSSVPMEIFFDSAAELDIFGYIEKPASAPEVVIVARKAAYYIGGLQ